MQISATETVFKLKERARIRRQIPTRKSVQNGEPDRLADLLEEAALVIEQQAQELRELEDELNQIIDSGAL